MGMNEDEGVGYLAEGALHDLISVLNKESKCLTGCVEEGLNIFEIEVRLRSISYICKRAVEVLDGGRLGHE